MTTTAGHVYSTSLPDVPRPFGRFRQFWAQRPRLTDAAIALLCLVTESPAALLLADDPYVPQPVPYPWRIVVVLVIGLSAVALMWRRSRPVLVYSYCMAAVLSTAVTGFAVTLLSSIVAIYSIAAYRRPRIGWICVAVSTPLIAIANTLAARPSDQRVYIAPISVFMVSLLLIGLLVGSNVYGVRRYQTALIERAHQLAVQSDQRAAIAASAERARIAREMHDIVSHSLTVVVALAEGASATPDRERAIAATQAIAATARNALAEMRNMLGVLRSDEHDAPLVPLTAEGVDLIVSGARGAGYPVTLTTSGVDHTEGGSTLALNRIVQEGLTNAMRHSSAQIIAVMLHHEPEGTTVRIENDGVKTEQHNPGYGLRGLRERVEHVGGTITAGETTARTWRLEAYIPAKAANQQPLEDVQHETSEEQYT